MRIRHSNNVPNSNIKINSKQSLNIFHELKNRSSILDHDNHHHHHIIDDSLKPSCQESRRNAFIKYLHDIQTVCQNVPDVYNQLSLENRPISLSTNNTRCNFSNNILSNGNLSNSSDFELNQVKTKITYSNPLNCPLSLLSFVTSLDDQETITHQTIINEVDHHSESTLNCGEFKNKFRDEANDGWTRFKVNLFIYFRI